MSMFRRMMGKSIPTDYVLAYDFNQSLVDKSVNNNTGIKTGTATFGAVSDGSKTIECLTFNTGLVTTTNNVNLTNTDKFSKSFWIRTNQLALAIIAEFSTAAPTSNNGFMTLLDGSRNVYMLDAIFTNYNVRTSTGNLITNNIWRHVVITNNRAENGINASKIYIDGILNASILNPSYTSDLNGNYSLQHKFFIGARSGQSLSFIGSLAKFKLYPRLLTTDEITQLYNE